MSEPATVPGAAKRAPRFPFRLAGRRGIAVLLAAGAGIALAAALGLLYIKTQGPDFRRHGEVLGWLRELKAIDARWDVDVLRTRTDFTPAPVPAADHAAPMSRIRRDLTAMVKEVNSPVLSRGLPELLGTFSQKAELVEKFRKANGVTKHALAQVLAADAEIAGLVRGSWQDFKDRERLVAAENAVTRLLAEAQKYYYEADETQRKNVEGLAAELRAAAAPLPTALREGLARLDANVQQLLGAKPIEEGLFDKLTFVTAGPRVDSLTGAFAAETEARLASRQRYRAYLAALSFAALVLIGYFALRLAARYRQLGLANEGLERRDAERTRSLTAALDQLKASEAQLIQTEKMSAIGQMVAGVAHEINTPLAYAKGSLEAVRGKLPGLAQAIAETDKLITMLRGGSDPGALARQLAVVQAHLAEIEQRQVMGELQTLMRDGLYGIDQISEIVVNLRSFARLDRGKLASFDLNEGLQSTLLVARHELKRHTVERHYGDIPPINCSPSQMNQVLLNLVNNAAQSIESERGTIRLTTRREDDAHVALEIEDNGKGIPPDVLPRIFDPSFSLRDAGRSTALGLSISHRIVEEHGGSITVDSAVGIGTKFRVVLPLNPPATEELAA